MQVAQAVKASQSLASRMQSPLSKLCLEQLAEMACEATAVKQEAYLKGRVRSIGVTNAASTQAWRVARKDLSKGDAVPDAFVHDSLACLASPVYQFKWLGIQLLREALPAVLKGQVVLPGSPSGSRATPVSLVETAVCSGYVNEWATADVLCSRVLGEAVLCSSAGQHEAYLDQLKRWSAGVAPSHDAPRREALLAEQPGDPFQLTGADVSMWLQRMACVALVRPAWRGGILPAVLEVSSNAANNGSRWTNLGIGWLLRSAAKHPEQSDAVLAHVASLLRSGRLSSEGLSYAVRLQPTHVKQEMRELLRNVQRTGPDGTPAASRRSSKVGGGVGAPSAAPSTASMACTSGT